MTTIVYKNKILAADRQVTISQMHSQTQCIDCGGKHFKVKEACKITIPVKGEYFGNKILAIAGSGNLAWLNTMKDMLQKNEDLHSFHKSMLRIHSASELSSKTGTLLVVTAKLVHVLQFSKMTMRNSRIEKIYPIDTDKVLAIGSGSEYAYSSAMCGGLSAQDAVRTAARCNQYTSLSVNYVDFSETPQPKIRTETSMDANMPSMINPLE